MALWMPGALMTAVIVCRALPSFGADIGSRQRGNFLSACYDYDYCFLRFS